MVGSGVERCKVINEEDTGDECELWRIRRDQADYEGVATIVDGFDALMVKGDGDYAVTEEDVSSKVVTGEAASSKVATEKAPSSKILISSEVIVKLIFLK